MKYLIDTSVISELVKTRPSSKVLKWISAVDDDSVFLSVLTIGELQKGIAKLPDDNPKKRTIQRWVDQDLMARFEGRILPVSGEIARRWGVISGEAERAGDKIPVIDCLIGATALVHGLEVATRNTRDLVRTSAKVFNPWD